MLRGALVVLQYYSVIVLAILLIKMFLLARTKQKASVGILGFVLLFPIFLFVTNVIL